MVVNYKIKDKNVKENRNKKFLKLFTIYQILELLSCFVFNFFTCLYYKGIDFDIYGVFSTSMIWTPGIVVQYIIALLFWSCSNKYYHKIAITTYCSLDFIFILGLMLIFIFFSPLHKYYIKANIAFIILIFLSKILFFEFVAAKYEDL
jgi:magnesium-transporting ATPase (P-type)